MFPPGTHQSQLKLNTSCLKGQVFCVSDNQSINPQTRPFHHLMTSWLEKLYGKSTKMCSMNFTQITQKVSLRNAHQAAVSEIPLAKVRNDVCFSKSGTSRKKSPEHVQNRLENPLVMLGYLGFQKILIADPNLKTLQQSNIAGKSPNLKL